MGPTCCCATARSRIWRSFRSTASTAATPPSQKALTQLSPAQVLAEVKASGLRGRGGAGFPDRDQVGLSARRHLAALRGGQRRRERAGHLQGPRALGRQPLPVPGRAGPGLLRGGGEGGLHLPARRVRAAGRRPWTGRSPSWSGPGCWGSACWGRTTACACTPTWGRGPTSAGRRRPCWNRWRASWASRGCARPSRPRPACTASRR